MTKLGEMILKCNHGEKSLEVPFVIYLDLGCLLLKILSYQNNPKNSYTERKAKRESSGWEIFTNCSFDAIKNKLDYYREKDCITLKIINYGKKKRNDTTI